MPNFRETDPSKIAVGFGGTMMLIAGLVYELVVIGAVAGPWHLLMIVSGGPEAPLDISRPWLWVSMAAGVALGGLAVFVPMRAGVRALRRMEF